MAVEEIKKEVKESVHEKLVRYKEMADENNTLQKRPREIEEVR